MDDAAQRRLVLFCRHSATAKPEYVTRSNLRGEHRVRVIPRELRDLIARDQPVYEALLAAGRGPDAFTTLADTVSPGLQFDLLDLVAGASLVEAEHARATASPVG